MKKPSFIARVLFFANNIWAILTWLAYLAWFFNPSQVPFLGVVALLVPAFIAVNVIFLVLWLIFYRRFAWVSLLTIALGWWHISGLIGFDSSKKATKSKDSIRVMTYNVRTFHYPGSQLLDEIPPGMTAIFDSIRPDILCMQEYLYGKRWMPDFKIQYQFVGTRSGLTLAIYSRFPIVQGDEIQFPDDSSVYSTFIYADVLLRSDTVRVVNIHLKSIGLKAEDFANLKRIENSGDEDYQESGKRVIGQLVDAYRARGKQVATIAKFIADSPHPVLLCGDFNDTPTSYAYRKFANLLDDSFVAAGTGFGTTIPRFSRNHLPLRIDHVFYPKEFKAINWAKIEANLSDHYPVFADLLPK